MLSITKKELIKKLPPREFWFVSDIAVALECCKRSVQYANSRKGIGRRVKNGKYGMIVFLEEDLDKLLEHLQEKAGRPAKKK